MVLVEAKPILDRFQSFVGRLDPSFGKIRLKETKIYHNVFLIPVKKEIETPLIFYGNKYQISSVYLAGFEDSGFIKVKGNKACVYYPLMGMPTFKKNNEIELMTSSFSDEEILKEEGFFYLVNTQGEDTGLTVVLSDDFPRQVQVPPIFVDAGTDHQISWEKKTTTPLKKLNPLFVWAELSEV